MHYIPHQRSLPPLPSASTQLNTQSWQRSSLPARTRPRSPPHTWQKSSIPIHARQRQRPSSTYNPDFVSSKEYFHHPPSYEKFSNSSSFYDRSRSTSTFNLYERSSFNPYSRSSSDRYSTDDLTPLHPRSHTHSLDRRYLQARSSSDPHKYSNTYVPSNSIGLDVHHRQPYQNRFHNKDDRFDYVKPYENPYKSYRNLNHNNNIEERGFHSVPQSYTNQRSYTPRSHHSKPSTPDEIHSNSSIPISLRSKASSLRRESPYERTSLGSRLSEKKEEYYQGETNYQERNNSLKDGSNTTPNFVYLKQPIPHHCTQVLATLVVSIGPFCAGLGKGYSSPALASMAALSAQGHHFSISKEQGSWVASLSLLGAFFGSLPAGMSINWGRKRVLCIVSIPFALSWVLTVVATNVYMLYAAAILGGICTAIISVVTPVYISEIAHPEIRGCLCAFSKLNSNVGMLISYLLGAFMNWRQLATVTAIAPACLFFSSLFIPETPSFLLYRGRDAEATESLKWLRGSTTDISREMTIMKSNITDLRRDKQQQQQQQQQHTHTTPRVLIRPLFITCGLMVFQKFSGANAFNFYAVPILTETFVGLNPYRAAVVVAFVQICAGMASSALVDTVGRRPLLVFSNMLMSAALAGFGCYVYVKGLHQNEDIFSRQEWRESDWVPLFCILVIEIAYSLGVSPISWLYMGELFPLKHRGFGALAASVSYACSFASVKTFVDLQTWLGLYGAFWFYASIAALALVFTLLFVPETKGKSLQEMQVQEQQKETLI